ncbi:hypothetical protein GTA08_BOTSDO03840 [Neofusicoccum parvum]|uniref:Uncharacterized protein n=1 Tax=Neofusicoccum parvum TaxID=310453 RepID=A0ACB5SLB7_9PEZI|nr:hypothetical protein GTA08_BOTSDO03840 [Neofusicoccum parvum]
MPTHAQTHTGNDPRLATVVLTMADPRRPTANHSSQPRNNGVNAGPPVRAPAHPGSHPVTGVRRRYPMPPPPNRHSVNSHGQRQQPAVRVKTEASPDSSPVQSSSFVRRPSASTQQRPNPPTPRQSTVTTTRSNTPAATKPADLTTPPTANTHKRKSPPTTSQQPSSSKAPRTSPAKPTQQQSPAPASTTTPGPRTTTPTAPPSTPAAATSTPTTTTTPSPPTPLTAAYLTTLERTLLHRRTASTHALTASTARHAAASARSQRARSAERAARAQISRLFLQSQVLDERAGGHGRVAREASAEARAAGEARDAAGREVEGAEGELMAIALGRMMARLVGRGDGAEVWARAEGLREVFLREGEGEEGGVGWEQGGGEGEGEREG